MAAARGTLYRVEIIEEVRRQLRCLPEPKIAEVSKLEVVRALAPDIEELQKAGHTIETIASTLSGLGVQLTKGTLRTYLGKLRPAGHRGRRRARQAAGRLAAGDSSGREGARECHERHVDNDGVRSTRKGDPGSSAGDRKENLSVITQEMRTKAAVSSSALGCVEPVPAAQVTVTTDASLHAEVFEVQPGTTDGSNGRAIPKELMQARSVKPTPRGSETPVQSERPAWTFVPRQDSNDI